MKVVELQIHCWGAWINFERQMRQYFYGPPYTSFRENVVNESMAKTFEIYTLEKHKTKNL